MSAGRKAYPLAGLQAAFESGMEVQVARGLLSDQDADVWAVPVWLDRSELLESPNLPETAYGMPADHEHRTTGEDIRREIRDLMVERSPEWKVWASKFVWGHYDDIPDHLLSPLASLHGKCSREVLATVPKKPGKKTKTLKMRPRWEGPCSAVVVRTRSGGTYSANGVAISEEDATALLDVEPFAD